MTKTRFIACIGVVAALGLCGVRAEDDKPDLSKLPPASKKTGVTYDADVKPIFEKSCVKCHSGEKAKAKLHLDSLAGAIKGGKEGPDIIPGKAGKSPLVYAVAHVGDVADIWLGNVTVECHAR